MKKITTIVSFLVFVAVLAYVLAFAVNNDQPLALDFLMGRSVEWPASVWLGMALVLGVAAGLLASLFVITQQKLRIRSLTKQLQKQSSRVSSIK